MEQFSQKLKNNEIIRLFIIFYVLIFIQKTITPNKTISVIIIFITCYLFTSMIEWLFHRLMHTPPFHSKFDIFHSKMHKRHHIQHGKWKYRNNAHDNKDIYDYPEYLKCNPLGKLKGNCERDLGFFDIILVLFFYRFITKNKFTYIVGVTFIILFFYLYNDLHKFIHGKNKNFLSRILIKNNIFRNYINLVGRNHYLHHMNKESNRKSFNVTFPGGDILMGTHIKHCSNKTNKWNFKKC